MAVYSTSAYMYYPIITIDSEKCEVCAKCVDECPRGVLQFDEKENKIIVLDPNNVQCVKLVLRIVNHQQ